MRVTSVLFNVPHTPRSSSNLPLSFSLSLSLGFRPLFLHNASCRYALKFYCSKKKLVPRWDLGRVLGISNPTTVRETEQHPQHPSPSSRRGVNTIHDPSSRPRSATYQLCQDS